MEQVVVAKKYLEALLRRNDFIPSNASFAASDTGLITTSAAKYNELVLQVRKANDFDTLKAALIRGGITRETLDTLIGSSAGSEADTPSCDTFHDASSVANGPQASVYETSVDQDQWDNLPRCQSDVMHHLSQDNHTGWNPARPSSTVPEAELDNSGSISEELGTSDGLPTTDNTNRTTLYLFDIPASATYSDLVSVLTGGRIQHISMRPLRGKSGQTAVVALVTGARELLALVKHHQVYVNGRKVGARWADSQYRVPQYVSNQIKSGASRNVVIGGAAKKGLTAVKIRDDLEHIDGLVIINVLFRGDDAYVSTNSIRHTLYARTCMLSRAAYKNCQIRFLADECDTPVQLIDRMPRNAKQELTDVKQEDTVPANRFHLLGLSDDDSGDDDWYLHR